MGNNWEKVFLPISIRYDTNSPHIFYQALAMRLQRLLNDHQPLAPAHDQAEFYKEKCIEYISRLCAQPQKKILLVIDGLDEAHGWEFDRTLFPRQAHPTFKVVVSARWLAGEAEGKQWRYRLGWDRRSDAEEIGLPPLDQSQIADLVTKANLSDSSDEVAAALARISGGDPLILSYLIEDALESGASTNRDATSHISGFAEYFAAWVETQRPSWLREAPEVDSMMGPIMGALACALGPISNSDLAAVIRLAFGVTTPITRQTLRPFQRFVIGDGAIGYSLAHPRLAEYFRKEYFQDGDVIPSVERAFVQYGEATVSELNAANASNTGVSRYLLNYYAQHLCSQTGTSRQFMALVQNGWRLAWEQTTDREHGFFRDVSTALNAIAASDGTVAQLFRCALCLTSVVSLGREIPVELGISSVKAGVLSWRKALEYAKSQGSSEFSTVVSQLAKIIPTDTLSLVLNEAIHIARREQYAPSKVRSMLVLSTHLTTEERRKLIDEALDAARTETNDFSYIGAIEEILPVVPAKVQRDVLRGALERIPSLRVFGNPDNTKAGALKSLAPFLVSEELTAALDIARGLTPLGNRWDGTIALARFLPRGRLFQELREIFSIATREDYPLLAGNREAISLAIDRQNILDLIANIAADFQQEELIAALAPTFTVHDQPIVIRTVEGIERLRFRGKALIALLAHLTGETQRLAASMLFELLPAIVHTEDAGDIPQQIIGAIISFLSTEEIRKCFELSISLADQYQRARCIATLADRLTKSELARGLESVRTIGEHHWCAHDLAEISTYLSPAIAEKARAQAVV